MITEIHAILVEDSADDAELNVLRLEADGLQVKAVRVECREEFIEALKREPVDVVLSDHSMPKFDAGSALELLREFDPDIPFILVSGKIGEQNAVKLIKAGANDYVLKDRLGRLPSAVRRELAEAETRRQNRRLEARIDSGQRRLAALMSNLPGMVFRLSGEPRFEFEFVSEGALDLVGYDPDSLTGMGFTEIVHPADRKRTLRALRDGERQDQILLEHRVLGAKNELRWVMTRAKVVTDSTGRQTVEGYCADVTAQREYQEELDFLAHHDTLTGLPNRTLFEEQFSQVLARARRNSTRVGLLFIDLDNFKEVNDSLGHQAGDELLKTVAGRLERTVRESDLVARLGGDEFVVAVEEMTHPEDPASLGKKLLEILQKPVLIEGHEVPVSASIGIACTPEDGTDTRELLRNADAAMYSAKADGRGRYHFYAEEMNARVRRLLSMRSIIPSALKEGQFELYLQPQVRMRDARIVGAEALLRWHTPEYGVLAAGEVVPIAEELGLIDRIDDWVINQGCRELAALGEAGHGDLTLSINISAQRFRAPNLVEEVRAAIERHGVAPGQLIIEITETSLITDSESALETMTELTQLGLRLSLDDFGTGYSSLNYLHRFPVSTLKMDRSFIERLPHDQDGLRLTSAIIAMAEGLGVDVIAEGVERQEQLELLAELGCHRVQGMLLGEPMPADQFGALAVERFEADSG